jgi:hypothetical protein
MLAGVFTAVMAVGVVTAYPGLVAACAVLRRRAEQDHGVGPRDYLAAVRQVAATGPAVFLVPPLILGILALDGLAVAAGVPGRAALAVVLAVCCAAVAVVGLRVASAWRSGTRWRELAASAVTRSRQDVRGSLLLLSAVVAAALIVLMVPVVVLFIAGPLAMAAVAVR